MFTRQNKKALRHTQKKGRVFLIKTNACIKKTSKERDMVKDENKHLRVCLMEAVEDYLEFKKKYKNSIKIKRRLRKENMILMKKNKCLHFIHDLVISVATCCSFFGSMFWTHVHF
jgi:hypothetical protein